MSRSTTDAQARSGLRERKKLKTRDALTEAALDLFHSRGYEATTVDDIAAAVDVSKRTFFRYFEGKEDVLLSSMRDVADELLAEVERRPADEAPLEALRAAGRHAIEQAVDLSTPHHGDPIYLVVIDLIESTPALVTAQLRAMMAHHDRLTAVIARREGVDPAVDPRPRLLVSVFIAAMMVASHAWQERGTADKQSLFASMDLYLDSIGPATSGHWTTTSA